jgi:peptidoglycan/xylan/chitin deacetylase (PgdA/CDA1 family)
MLINVYPESDLEILKLRHCLPEVKLVKKHLYIGSIIFFFLIASHSNVCTAAVIPIDHVQVSQSIVALTIEGADNAEKLNEIIDFCQQENIRLSFFYPSQIIAQNKTLIKKAVKQGHEFGIYGVKQQYWDELREEDIRKEMVIADTTLRQVAGKSLLMKPPCQYYESTVLEAVSAYDPKLKIIRGINEAGWPAEVKDSPSGIMQHIVSGDVINVTITTDQSLTAMKRLTKELKNQGFQIVTVSHLLSLAKEKSS